MNPWDIAIPVISTLLGGGLVTALVKAGPQRRQVVVESAETVVIMQDKYIKSLVEQVQGCEQRAAAAERKADEACASVERMGNEMNDLRDELATTRRERDGFANENQRLHGRVQELERKVGDLEQREARLASELGRITPPGGTPATE